VELDTSQRAVVVEDPGRFRADGHRVRGYPRHITNVWTSRGLWLPRLQRAHWIRTEDPVAVRSGDRHRHFARFRTRRDLSPELPHYSGMASQKTKPSRLTISPVR